ncbi:hypothetical protein GCM10010840_23440 [Deinococcus aerolatus]|uniref:Uncharacterized protein n=1 Tax=Deinococcus aerolatus TaxID=522487 RepID=A0ABQ2GC45_9DEIO|nr:hypothetical protein [Deinococcus aerolatus]GGL84850.1 hypothetical protein GCM10010840_23440 [Deinococcus aerolatus]
MTGVQPDRVRLVAHNVFLDTGDDVTVESELRFHSRQEITRTLERAGFTLEQGGGDWQRHTITLASHVMVFVTRA